RQMPAHLTPDGRAAVVVVRPLAALVHDTLLAAGCELLAQARGGDHWVTHFRGGTAVPPEPPADPLAPYVRGQFSFKVGQTSYQLTAVYNLPEFDTLSHDTRLAISTLRGERVAGRVLVWNPGQGHVPVYLRQRFGRQIAHYVLAGRDLLSLHVSAHNLRAHGVPEAHITRLHLPHLLAVRGPFDWAVVFPDADAGVPWAERLLPGCAGWLGENGRLLLTTRSTFAHRLLAQPHPFRKRQDRKRHGYRTLLLQLTAPAL
ncbi:MAG: hypothetical protein KC425_22460, partial [Anaerolineales bacterium]|nr:hypothetical protein [Anaerolineales bacterium]